MMNRFFKMMCLAGVAIPLTLTTSVRAQTNDSEIDPVQLVRSLQDLQDNIAKGQPGALEMQPRVLADIGQKFENEDFTTWEDKKNLYSVLIYLFNGGNPNVVEPILLDAPEGIIPKNYIDGALAYIHNQRQNFLKAFDSLPTNGTDVPAALLLSISLSTVADLTDEDADRASVRLNWVRLAAPGSLFEEAAIRRQIRIASLLGDAKLFKMLARNYVTRFSKSYYVNEFWRDFVTALSKLDSHLTDQELEEFVAYAPKRIELIIYLNISRSALIDARMARAHFSAQKAIDLSRELQVDDVIARLYYAASSVGTTAAENAGEMLKTISINDLPERDRPLLMAAMAIAKGVASDTSILPEPKGDDEESSSIDDDTGDVSTDVSEKQLAPLPVPTVNAAARNDEKQNSAELEQFMKQAKKKLDEVDKLLEKK